MLRQLFLMSPETTYWGGAIRVGLLVVILFLMAADGG